MPHSSLSASVFSIVLGSFGVIALILLTDFSALYAASLPLAFFALLSFIVKRAGFHVAPLVTHSLVGIVDLAAVFVFGPIQGAWVAATSGASYLILNAVRRARLNRVDLFEIPLFNAGLKIGMAYASTALYRGLHGNYAPEQFTLGMIPAVLAAILAWFALDHIGWGILEFLHSGLSATIRFYRVIFRSSLFVELLPLPFSIVIAVVYSTLDVATFLMMSLGLVGTAIVVQQFADASARLERRRNELVVLNDFSQALSSVGFHHQRVIELLSEHARRIVPADLYHIELFEDDKPSPLRDYFHEHREPILIPDLLKQPAPIALEPIDGIPPRGALVVPLRSADRLTGALSVYTTRAGRLYPIHARNLLSMCTEATVAIQNTRLYVAERRRATQLTTVSAVSREVAAFLELEELLSKVVYLIRDQFGYTHVHIFTTDAAARRLIFRASTHPNAQNWRQRGMGYQIGLEGIVGWVAAMGEPMRVNDVSKEPRYLPYPDQIPDETRSEIVVPLMIGTRVIGVLDVESNQLNAFTEDDLFILKTLAEQIALAIEDARLYRAQKEEAYYLNVLLQVAENLTATTDLDEALQTVVRITPLLIGVDRCAIFLFEPRENSFVPAQAYGLQPTQQRAFKRLKFMADDRYAFGEMLRRRSPLVIADTANPLLRPSLARAFDLNSLLVAPLMTRGSIMGALLVDQGARHTRFSDHQIDVVMGIANQAAVAIEGARLGKEAEEKRRLEHELGLARQIQTSFLPEACPHVSGYEIASLWQSARQVSGDFYDFVQLSGSKLAITIADVSDKGIAAAMFMALSRTILRTMTIGKPRPRETIARANDIILSDARSDMFVTVFHAVLEPHSGRLTYVNAGHNPPLLYRAQHQKLTALASEGIALGVMPKISYQERELTLGQGDVLLLYTDGVIDAIDGAEEHFGSERLARVVAQSANKSAEQLIEEIKRAVLGFAGGEGAHFDDLTLVAVKRVLPIP